MSQGLLINVAAETSIENTNAFGIAPHMRLAGLCKLPYDFAGLYGEFAEAILFVAVDMVTHRPFMGQFRSAAQPLDPPKRGSSQPDLVVTKYFNPELFSLLSLPHQPAHYMMYALLREHRSNILRVRVTS